MCKVQDICLLGEFNSTVKALSVRQEWGETGCGGHLGAVIRHSGAEVRRGTLF